MIALLGKELRQLVPIAWLWLAILALGYALQFVGSRIDEETFGSWFEAALGVGPNPALAALQALIALVTAWALFPREHDDSTIDFLRAMPVSQPAIFIAKVLAGWLVLLALTWVSYGLDAALLAFSPESIGGRFYAQPFWTMIWRDAAFYFVVLAHGVVLSWFRVIGLIVYAIYLFGVAWLESATGSAGLFSVLGMLSNEFDGSRLVVDTTSITVHLAIALLLLVLGYRLWSRTPSAVAGGRQRGRGAALIGVFVTVAAFLALAGALLTQVGSQGELGADGELAVATTAHFRFVYAIDDEQTVDYVLEHADADFEALGAMLGTNELPSVRVNLAAASEHAAGLATWKTILMDLSTFEADLSQRRVLSHESAHVMQSVLSERALARHAEASRFFVEGMAQYLSFAIVPEPGRRASNRAIAAVAWQRQDIRFEDLIDGGFAARFDPDLYYSLGDLWTEAFVATCGEASLGDFLRAAGREEVPRSLPAAIFWRDTLREIDCELESVNATFRTRMQALYDETDRALFPRFEDTVVSRLDDGRVSVIATLEPDEEGGELTRNNLPARFSIRVGGNAQLVASVDPVFRGELLEESASDAGIRVRFLIPPRAVPRTRFEYQLGYAPYDDSRVWFDKRRTGSAAPATGAS